MIKFSCNGCGRVYRVSVEYAEKRVRCKECSQINTIPQSKNKILGSDDSVTRYDNLLRELAKAEKAAPAIIESDVPKVTSMRGM